MLTATLLVAPGLPDLAVVAAGGGAVLYGLGLRRWRPAPWQPRSFAAGLVIVWLSTTALDGVAHRSLAGHMVQHLLLWGGAAPLLAAGAPLPTMLWALPPKIRRPGLDLWRRARRMHDHHWLGWTLVAAGGQGAVLWAWHLPVLYDAAVRHTLVHGLEHLTFTATAVVFFWSVAGGRRSGGGALAVFVAGFPGTALGAGLLLAPRPWYPAYGDLHDQQLAGVLMWSGMGLTYVLAAVVLFAGWLASDEQPSAVPA
ncbi:MAG: cytochrome c oxidase assembly protein [Acidobacteria bacterium]|nr:cytochrome c oxidase assembly protein [Acidobacteriota bacterium]